MSDIKLNFQAGEWNDITILNDIITQANSNFNSIDSSIAKSVDLYQGTFAGLKDASGANGDIIVADGSASVYIKLNSMWFLIDASIVSLG